MVLGGGATALVVTSGSNAAAGSGDAATGSGPEIRLEVETASGTATRIRWDVTSLGNLDGRQRGDTAQPGAAPTGQETVPTPWSVTVPMTDEDATITLMARSAPDDVITCRVVVDGEVVAEESRESGPRGIGCMHGAGPLPAPPG